MRKIIIIILFLFISVSVNATIYWVTPRGSNANTGADSSSTGAWLTWHYAFNQTAVAGDTVYFRGGIYTAYSTTIGAQLNNAAMSGTYNEPTCFFAYPADWATGNYPIFDGSLLAKTQNQWGIEITKVSNIHFKGLWVRNVRQVGTAIDSKASGWFLWSSYSMTDYAPNNIRFENCVAHHIGGAGFEKMIADTLYFINCDAFNCCDSLSVADPGGHGEGFGIFGRSGTHNDAYMSYTYLFGCRAWMCSDQGFSYCSKGVIVTDHCWSIHNGDMPFPTNTARKGSAWKLWYYDATQVKNSSITQIVMHNSIGAYNAFHGWNWTDASEPTMPEIRCHIYNNLFYGNTYSVPYYGSPWGYNMMDDVQTDTVGKWDHKYYNNLSYDVNDYRYDILGGVNGSNNLWNVSGSPVTDLYFLSLDTAGMLGVGTRKADGSLPDTDFGKSSSTSPLIDAGIDVFGIDFNGEAPDIGWVEYEPQDPPVDPIVIVVVDISAGAGQATIGCNVTDDGGGTVSDRGVCWALTANPVITDSHNHNGTGTGTFNSYITGLLPITTYHVRAFATNEAGTGYSADSEFMTTSDAGLGGDVVFSPDGKPLFIYDNVSGTWKILVK